MQSFTQVTGVVVPLDRINVDTDAIIPKQFLKSIRRSGFGPNLFDEWRYLDRGEPDQESSGRPLNPDFVLNQPRYRGAKVLLTRDNFGCGSSREHAPWALQDFGIRVIIAPSFADIFHQNGFKIGLLLLVLPGEVVERLFRETEAQEGYALSVDLVLEVITTPTGETIPFQVNPFRRECLLNGWDEIGLTLRHLPEIEAYEANRRREAAWSLVTTGEPA